MRKKPLNKPPGLCHRREFLKVGLVGGVAAAFGCDPDGKTRAYPYQVDEDVCRGCGECVDPCWQDAILIEKQSSYTVLRDRCTGCGTCEQVCQYHAAALDKDFISHIDPDTCELCGDCYKHCAYKAIRAELYTARIDQIACVHCGECVELEFCRFDAIYSTYL